MGQFVTGCTRSKPQRPPRSVSTITGPGDPRLLTCPVCQTGAETGPMFDDGVRWPAHPTCMDWIALPPPNPGIRRRK